MRPHGRERWVALAQARSQPASVPSSQPYRLALTHILRSPSTSLSHTCHLCRLRYWKSAERDFNELASYYGIPAVGPGGAWQQLGRGEEKTGLGSGAEARSGAGARRGWAGRAGPVFQGGGHTLYQFGGGRAAWPQGSRHRAFDQQDSVHCFYAPCSFDQMPMWFHAFVVVPFR